MLWRYTAIAAGEAVGGGGAPARGEIAADSAADVRAALRRAGLIAVRVRRVRSGGAGGSWPGRGALLRHLRRRRAHIKADLFDALATMHGAGIPLAEALRTIAGGSGSRAGRSRAMVAVLHAELTGGRSLADSMRSMPSWFDDAEAAMMDAGERSGEVNAVLVSLRDRRRRQGELGQKVAGALAYPALVFVAGVLVAVFLSTRTLPELTRTLSEAGVGVPALTEVVMHAGAGVAAWFWLAPALAIGAVLGAMVLRGVSRVAGFAPPSAPSPRVCRTALLGDAMLGLAELLRTGVPMVDALRLTAPTLHGPWSGVLRARLLDTADKVERGESVSAAVEGDHRWFNAETARLLHIGETSGELHTVLNDIGERLRRSARRSVDRIAGTLEPIAILLLSVFVGLVVFAAVLPLTRLQEALG